MRTLLQRQASRFNGLKSTGPRTESGKRRSSRNAITHHMAISDAGLLADPIVRDEFEAVLEAYQNQLLPETPAEHDAVRRLALLRVRFGHVLRCETNLIHRCAAGQEPIPVGLAQAAGRLESCLHYVNSITNRLLRATSKLVQFPPPRPGARRIVTNEPNLTPPDTPAA